MKIKKKKLEESISKAWKSLYKTFPVLLGTILLISFITKIIPKSFYTKLFTNNIIIDPFIGSLTGSISAGSPVISYILGGEFLNQGIGILTVTAFIVAWVTVGLIQLPAESSLLGKKFAIIRNITSFIFAIIVAIITLILKLI